MFAHNFAKTQSKLFPGNFTNSFRAVFSMTSMSFVVCCFEKIRIVLNRNFGRILFQKSLSIQQFYKLNIGYLPEDFQIKYNSAILCKLILLCVNLSLKNCQSSLRRSANFHSTLWLLKIIIMPII